MKRTIRLNETELKRMISESLKRVINEYYEGESHDGQLTVGELIAELEKCNKDARVELFDGNNSFHSISNVYQNYLFKSGIDYKKWKEQEEAASQNLPYNNKYDHGEDFF